MQGIPDYADRYDIDYPLRDRGMDRAACKELIYSVFGYVPPKSACFFCSASQFKEIDALAVSDPVLYVLARAMEILYRSSSHFRGDRAWNITAVHKVTGEKYKQEVQADSAAGARSVFRATMKDTATPYAWKVAARKAVVGLGGRSTWLELPITLDDQHSEMLVRFAAGQGMICRQNSLPQLTLF